MAKRTLNDRLLRSLKPAKSGSRYEVMDTIVPGFGVRVTDRGQRSFILTARYGRRHPVRRKLGVYGAMPLEKARAKARQWIELIQQGIDPAQQERNQKLAELRKREVSFAAVSEDFIHEKLASERKGREASRDIRSEFATLAKVPLSDVGEDEILRIIKAKARTAPHQARNLLSLAKRFFSWAIDQRVYGLKRSPCADLKPVSIVGQKRRRDRTLSDDELFAFWRATKRMPYPFGQAYQLLALTGLRLNEVADAGWTEFPPSLARALREGVPLLELTLFDSRDLAWTIPAARMKGRSGHAREHVVPLTRDLLAVLRDLPRLPGNFLFSTTAGRKPAWLSTRVKRRLDQRMLRTLRAIARRRGDDAGAVTIEPWTNHDIRRTVRSGLSRLRVSEEAREAVLAHARSGITAVYDKYDYFDEKLEALNLWAGRLHSIVDLSGGLGSRRNVIALRAGRRVSI